MGLCGRVLERSVDSGERWRVGRDEVVVSTVDWGHMDASGTMGETGEKVQGKELFIFFLDRNL